MNSVIHLPVLLYYSCAAIFIFFVFGVFHNLKDSSALFCSVGKKGWLALAAVCLAAAVLRFGVIEHRHYVFYDEYEHINIAKNMAESKQFSRCDLYLDGRCLSFQPPQWTPGYHFLLSLVFRLFGPSEEAAFLWNAVLGVFSVAALFLVLYLITEQWSISTVFAFVLTMTPLHMKFSGNSSPEMASFLFISLSVLALLIFSKSQTDGAFLQLVSVAAYTLLLRPENGLILLLIMAWLAFFARTDRRYFGKAWSAIVAFIPYVLCLMAIRDYQITRWFQHNEGEVFLTEFFRSVHSWTGNQMIPLACVILAGIGALGAFKKDGKIIRWSVVYFFIFLIFYSLMRRTMMGDTQRLNLQFYLPVIILAVFGFKRTCRLLGEFFRSSKLAFAVLIAVIFFNCCQAFPFIFEEISLPVFQEEYKLLLKGRAIDDRVVFISCNPSFIITVLGKSSVLVSQAMDEQFFNAYLKDRDLVLVDDYWCARGEGGCGEFKKKYRVEPFYAHGQQFGREMFYLVKK